MSIVTKTGDQGATSLMYGRRVSKCDPRVEACGTVDELNAALGLARAAAKAADLRDTINSLQQELILLMGELATLPEDFVRYTRDGFKCLDAEATARLEKLVEELEATGSRFNGWATPGETLLSAALDMARTVCRRAERSLCKLQEADQLPNAQQIIYLNRLSDLLWLMARRAEAVH
jgi:cob(I)alamin adenosyltransferase